MNKNTTNTILIAVAVALLMGTTAAVASYATRESMEPKPVAAKPVTPKAQPQKLASNQPVHQASAPAPQPKCDDNNIVGTVAGGAAGGLIGSQIGSGRGNTAAIIGGTVGGAVLGNQYIPTRGVTCR